jgi:hypothetical protein
VLSLYYDDELNLREIGKVLGVSESQVCQIRGQAVLRIRGRIEEWLSVWDEMPDLDPIVPSFPVAPVIKDEPTGRFRRPIIPPPDADAAKKLTLAQLLNNPENPPMTATLTSTHDD